MNDQQECVLENGDTCTVKATATVVYSSGEDSGGNSARGVDSISNKENLQKIASSAGVEGSDVRKQNCSVAVLCFLLLLSLLLLVVVFWLLGRPQTNYVSCFCCLLSLFGCCVVLRHEKSYLLCWICCCCRTLPPSDDTVNVAYWHVPRLSRSRFFLFCPCYLPRFDPVPKSRACFDGRLVLSH